MTLQSIFNAKQVNEIENLQFIGTVNNVQLEPLGSISPNKSLYVIAGGFATSCAIQYLKDKNASVNNDPSDQTRGTMTPFGDIDVYKEMLFSPLMSISDILYYNKKFQVIETPEVEISDSTRENLSKSQLYLYRVKYGAFIVHLFDINMCQAFMVPNGEMWDIYVTQEFMNGYRERKIHIRGRYQNFLETWNRCIKYSKKLYYRLPDPVKLEVLSRGKRSGYNSQQPFVTLHNMGRNLVEKMDEGYRCTGPTILIDNSFEDQFKEISSVPLGHAPDKLKHRLENYPFPEDNILLDRYARLIILEICPKASKYVSLIMKAVKKLIGHKNLFYMYMNGELSQSNKLKGLISFITDSNPEDVRVPDQIFSDEVKEDHYAPKCMRVGNVGLIPISWMYTIVINLDTGYACIRNCYSEYNHTSFSMDPSPRSIPLDNDC